MKLSVAKERIERLSNIPFKEYLGAEQVQDRLDVDISEFFQRRK